jgi:hypothetical protein
LLKLLNKSTACLPLVSVDDGLAQPLPSSFDFYCVAAAFLAVSLVSCPCPATNTQHEEDEAAAADERRRTKQIGRYIVVATQLDRHLESTFFMATNTFKTKFSSIDLL